MQVSIETLDHHGRGIAKWNQKVVFVPNTLPNELVEIKITKEKKNYMEGECLHVLKKSPFRIDSPCPYYPACGGCQLLHLPYLEQLRYKENKLRDIFKRYHLEDVLIEPIVASPKPLHYRNKVTFQNENNQLGYYEENSYHFIPIRECLLLDEKINQEISNLPTNQGKITVRTNHQEVCFDSQKKVMHTIADYRFLVSLESFFQVNDYVTPLLYTKAKEYLASSKEETVLDLYCGTGTIGIFVSKDAKKVIGIEKNETAIQDAKENAKLNHVTNIEFICGDAGKEADKLKSQIDSIIIDPPRSGLNNQTIETILKLNPKKIVYISCDPMTLVRDLNILKQDYQILEITPFDMFPNTYHVECVCALKHK